MEDHGGLGQKNCLLWSALAQKGSLDVSMSTSRVADPPPPHTRTVG